MKIGTATLVVSVTNEEDSIALQNYLFSIGYKWIRTTDGIKSLADMCNANTAIYINSIEAEAMRLMFGQLSRADPPAMSFSIFKQLYINKIKIDVLNEGVYF